jgi:hypothetical protein
MAEIDSKPFNEIAKCLFYVFNKNSYILVGNGEPTETGVDFTGIDEVWTGRVKDYEPITGESQTFKDWDKKSLDTYKDQIIYFDKTTNSFWKPDTVTTDLSNWTWVNITKDIELMIQDLYVPDGDNYARFDINSTKTTFKNNAGKVVNLRGYRVKYNSLNTNLIEKILIRDNNLVLSNIDDVGSYSVKRIVDTTGKDDKVQVKWNKNTWELLKNSDFATLNVAYIILNGLMLDPDATGGITIDTFIPKYPYNKIIQSQSDLDSLIIESGDYIYIDDGTYNINTDFDISADNVRIDCNPSVTFKVSLQTGHESIILVSGSNNTINMTLDGQSGDYVSIVKVAYKNETGDLFYKNNKLNIVVKDINTVDYVIDDWGYKNVFNMNAIGFNFEDVFTEYNSPRGIGWMEVSETFEVGEDEISEKNIYKGQFGSGTYYNSVLYGFLNGEATIGTAE